MQLERAKELQQRITTEGLAMLELGGPAADTSCYEQGIRFVGKAFGLADSETEAKLRLLAKERDDVSRERNGEAVTKSALEGQGDVMCNWSGMEVFDTIMDLFEASVNLETCGERTALLNLAHELVSTQNFLDWIEQTPAEKAAAEG